MKLSGYIYSDPQYGTWHGIRTSISEVLPGDFNSDGIVDAADYTVARDAEFPLTALLTSDAIWRENYGATSEAGQKILVPEPEVVSMIAATAFVTLYRQGRRPGTAC